MAGIYIHIPFCHSKCAYCSFFSVTSLRDVPNIIEAISIELQERKQFLQQEMVETIYFGGGTPSLLGADKLSGIIDTIKKHYTVSPTPEITIEANPDDLTIDYLEEVAKIANRLSIGIQSFNDDDLSFIGRSHNAATAIEAFLNARKAGFRNMSIDLIYGISADSALWKKNLDTAVALNPEHISAYALTIEERTVLQARIRQGRYEVVSEDLVERQYQMLTDVLAAAGYEHYEISNFSKPGFQSRHNSSYWEGKSYLGIGPSAHSFNGEVRCWNLSNIQQYYKGITEGSPAFAEEKLTENDKYNEFVMLNLRKSSGIDLRLLKEKFNVFYSDYFVHQITPYIYSGHVIAEENVFRLKESSFLISDGIIADLFAEA